MSFKRKFDLLKKNQQVFNLEFKKLEMQVSKLQQKIKITKAQTNFMEFKIFLFNTEAIKQLQLPEELFNIIFEYALTMFMCFYTTKITGDNPITLMDMDININQE